MKSSLELLTYFDLDGLLFKGGPIDFNANTPLGIGNSLLESGNYLHGAFSFTCDVEQNGAQQALNQQDNPVAHQLPSSCSVLLNGSVLCRRAHGDKELQPSDTACPRDPHCDFQ